MATDGTLVLSGLIPRDVPGVLSAYAAQGFRLRRRRLIEGWVTLELRRGGARPGALKARASPTRAVLDPTANSANFDRLFGQAAYR